MCTMCTCSVPSSHPILSILPYNFIWFIHIHIAHMHLLPKREKYSSLHYLIKQPAIACDAIHTQIHTANHLHCSTYTALTRILMLAIATCVKYHFTFVYRAHIICFSRCQIDMHLTQAHIQYIYTLRTLAHEIYFRRFRLCAVASPKTATFYYYIHRRWTQKSYFLSRR